ncbi:hypothetical protein CR513_33204, partial [Mucuna pruriens]
MARFLNGLNRDIVNVLEMYQYVELQEMMHQEIKVEQQLKRRNSVKKNYNLRSFPWKDISKKKVVGSHSKAVDSKKNEIEVNPSKNRHINMIIDGGSCTNVDSSILVEKLNLQTAKHLRLYKLQWLSDIGEVKVDKQVLVPFTIGKYKD